MERVFRLQSAVSSNHTGAPTRTAAVYSEAPLFDGTWQVANTSGPYTLGGRWPTLPLNQPQLLGWQIAHGFLSTNPNCSGAPSLALLLRVGCKLRAGGPPFLSTNPNCSGAPSLALFAKGGM